MPITNNLDLLSGDRKWEGRVNETQPLRTWTGFNKSGSILVPGQGACAGTAYNDLILPVDANSVFRGIPIYTDTFEKLHGITINSDGKFGYPIAGTQNDYPMGYDFPVTYLDQGVIAVAFSTAIAVDANPFLVYTADGGVAGERVGMWRNTANSGKAFQVTSVRVLEPLSAAGVTWVSVSRT